MDANRSAWTSCLLTRPRSWRVHGTVRVFNHPMEGQVILDVAQPLDVIGATRSICYLSPADAGALGGELIGAAMDAERYAREGYR